MNQNIVIKNIIKNSSNLEIDWSDGKKASLIIYG